jgi:UDP-N-acetylglucosamine diphosphorylase / glucose-1-phosphate thymidylyltransferase / UDP-N-acetylgalactosamine diphosphorylase / glucosamine-1-phosphate N-acetyltransferase / galactosamine-1-phosphate N-acetyltransferase
MENGASVEPMVFFDTSAGPVLVREGASVHAFSRIIGPAVIGRKSSVVGGRVAAVSIGEVCKVSGEMSNTIMLGHSNKGHDGFVGHSYMGRWVNLGAGTTTSNLKNTYGAVPLWTPDGIRDTGQQFLGTMFGDHAKTGIGTQLNTGTVLGAGANVFGGEMPPKYVPPFSWGDREPYGEFEVEKFLKVAERMMARRHVTIGDGCREQLRKAHGLALVRRRRRAEGA